MNEQLPPFLEELLRTPPQAGEGVHQWLFRVSRQLHAHMPATEIVTLLARALVDCGRHVPHKEIVDAVANSLRFAWQPSNVQSVPATPKWPPLNQKARNAITHSADSAKLADLWEASPVRFEDNKTHTEELIDQLFPGDPLLCCGLSKSNFDTRLRSEWRDQLAQLQVIVPSPMTARTGLTRAGEESAHTLASTGPRWYLVTEFDQGDVDEHAAILCHFAEKAPLTLVVHSGNKSLQGWFFCVGRPEEKLERFFRYAVTLGADPATWCRSQFVRMPDGTRRSNGIRQAVYFFNPEAIKI